MRNGFDRKNFQICQTHVWEIEETVKNAPLIIGSEDKIPQIINESKKRYLQVMSETNNIHKASVASLLAAYIAIERDHNEFIASSQS